MNSDATHTDAVAPRDEVRPQLVLDAVVREADVRLLGRHVVHAEVGDLEVHLPAVGAAAFVEVLDDLLLAVDADRPPGQLREGDVQPLVVELQVHAVVHVALAIHALADTGLPQEVHGALFEHSGAHSLLDVLLAAPLQHHRVDALQAEQVGQQQSGGASAHDRDLSTHETRFLPWLGPPHC